MTRILFAPSSCHASPDTKASFPEPHPAPPENPQVPMINDVSKQSGTVHKPITLRGQSSMRPENQNSKNNCLRVSAGDIGENSRDQGDKGKNG